MENSLIDRDKLVIWHPYTAQKYAPDPIPIIKGDGVYLTDTDGNSYIDAISSWWVNLHGHAHPYIAEKIYQQAKTLEQVIFAGFTHEPAVQLAEKLIGILPGHFSKIFYSDNGSTAVEVAIKMAIQYWWNLGSQDLGVGSLEPGVGNERRGKKRNKILALKNSYHGDTFGAMSVSDRGIFTLAFQDKLFEVIFIDALDLNSNGGDLSIEDICHATLPTPDSKLRPNDLLTVAHPDEIACFIYEPLIQGAGGMKMYEAKVLDQLIKACRDHGIICIADEVMTGFGRTGKFFASAYLEHKPDIICLSKGLTGGTMALGVTACTKEIHEAFVSDDRLKTFFHGHSFTANPLACTAALASLDLLQQEECLNNIDRISQQHQEYLTRLKTLTSNGRTRLKNLRQLGTILAFEIELNEQDGYLNNIGQVLTRSVLSRGVFLRPLGNTVYIMPPYCITREQLQTVYDVLTAALVEL